MAVLTALGLAVTSEVGAYRQTRGSVSAVQYGSQIGTVVRSVQKTARPGAAVVVTGAEMTNPGWKYYGYEYAGQAAQGRTTDPAKPGRRSRRSTARRPSPP